MASFAFYYALALLFVAASASGPMMASPEPEMDPMGGPALYIVCEGTGDKVLLKRRNKVCPDDYPHGFSILCEPGGPSSQARFFVNGELVRVEYKDPYYIAGDNGGVIKPWKDYPKKAKIRCKVSRKSNVFAKIKFKC